MADSFDGLGTTEIFPFDINWVTEPSETFASARFIIQFPGTETKIESFSTDAPDTFIAKVLLADSVDIYNFLEFFNSVKGRFGRFWIKLPVTAHTLKSDITSGSTTIPVYRNDAHLNATGNERIWIEMNNGDIITRHVSSMTVDIPNDKLGLNMESAIGVELTTTNHAKISNLMLCRFKSDSIRMKIESDSVSAINLKVVELIQEFTDI